MGWHESKIASDQTRGDGARLGVAPNPDRVGGPACAHDRGRVEPAQGQDASGRQMACGAGHPGPRAARTSGALREIVAGTAVQLYALVLLARNHPYAVMLDFVEPLGA